MLGRKDHINYGITNIEFRYLRYRVKKEVHTDMLPKKWARALLWLGFDVPRKPPFAENQTQEWRVQKAPTLQYRFFSESTREWTGWIDIPFVDEGDLEKAVTSNARLRIEYGDLKDDKFKLDL